MGRVPGYFVQSVQCSIKLAELMHVSDKAQNPWGNFLAKELAKG